MPAIRSLALAALCALCGVGLAWPTSVGAAPADIGAAIYLQGVTSDGKLLTARRQDAAPLYGAEAACVNCHRRSGFGGQEGRSTIPPITARYLFPAAAGEEDRDIPYVPGMRGNRPPYSEATLARAIREGVDTQERSLSYLMPQFDLSDTDMAALVAYLRRMDRRHVPGTGDGALHLATIITPDADPLKRQAMLSVLTQFFSDRNARQLPTTPRLLTSGKTAYSKSMFRTHPRWILHVWELGGPASGWQRQLENFLAREPVFAVLSGVGATQWEPVHAFCEAAALPCLFPNLELPVVQSAPEGNYSLYFSKGVLLEAELMVNALLASKPPPATVRQIYRTGDVGEGAARAVAAMLESRGVRVHSAVLGARDKPEAVHSGMGGMREDAVLLWLRPADLAALPDWPSSADVSAQAPLVYLSGLMGGLENAPLPPGWRSQAHMAYPFDLPQARRVRVDFALGWMSLRKIPLIATQLQVDTYLACGLLSEALNHMADNLDRDYLIERLQSLLEHRIVTGYYPHLTLANGQHFASKGGYLVRFADTPGARVEAEGEWQVP